MKNNRQIGLNGKVFISSCLKRGSLFVIMLMAGGIFTAVADIMKLTGLSGAVMSSFTTTLLIYDFMVSLVLVVVVFYAYFLECGTSVPVLRERPLVVFGLFRLGYYILLAYYICYRALYCLVNHTVVSPFLSIFYLVYFVFIFLCILANCFVYNIVTRNVIRRSYMKNFRTLSTFGIIVQILLPITYIIARVTMRDVGDEFFTDSLCDLFRLCICPIFTASVWFLFIHGVEQVIDVFSEVDSALSDRRYQITYSAPETEDSKKKLPGSGARKASAAFLPTPPTTPDAAQRSLPAASHTAAKLPAEKKPVSQPAKPVGTVKPTQSNQMPIPQPMTNPVQQFAPAAYPVPQPLIDSPDTVLPVVSAEPTEFGTMPQIVTPATNAPYSPEYPATLPPVEEYNPFPAESVPLHPNYPPRRTDGNGQQRGKHR